MKLETSIMIDAPVTQVWEVFVDFKKYPEWNPFVLAIDGEVAKNEQIAITLPTMNFKPTVLKFDEASELRWLGKLWMKGIFDGEHYFQFKAIDENRTQFIHDELFKGILVPLMLKQLNGSIKKGFEEMNQTLKTRAEKNR